MTFQEHLSPSLFHLPKHLSPRRQHLVVGCRVPADFYSYNSRTEVAFDSLLAVDIVGFDVVLENASSCLVVADVVSSDTAVEIWAVVDPQDVKRAGGLEVDPVATHSSHNLHSRTKGAAVE